MCPEELVALISSISIMISQNTSSIEELEATSFAFTLLSDSLKTIVAQRVYLETRCKKPTPVTETAELTTLIQE